VQDDARVVAKVEAMKAKARTLANEAHRRSVGDVEQTP